MTSKTAIDSEPKKSKTTKGKETRIQIIESALNIIKRDGMRGVRHRAVATEANVPLGATTYHFKNIEDLITSVFIHWRQMTSMNTNPYISRIADFLAENAQDKLDSQQGRAELAESLYKFIIEYELDQVDSRRDNRIIELAFYHESLHSDKLRQEVFAYWQTELDGLKSFFESIDSSQPEADARIVQSIFHQLEREALMQGDNHNIEAMKIVIRRIVQLLLGVS